MVGTIFVLELAGYRYVLLRNKQLQYLEIQLRSSIGQCLLLRIIGLGVVN